MYTAAGLMPLAACGFDVLQVAEGARSQIRGMESKSLEENPAMAYATTRLAAIEAGRTVELLWTEGPRWEGLANLWRYLLAGGSLLPTRAGLNSDRWMIEPWQRHNREKTLNTVLTLEVVKNESTVPEVPGWPAAAALAGQKLAELFPRLRAQAIASQASDGYLTIGLPRLDAFHLGALCAFFQRSNALAELAREASAFDEHPLHLGAAR
jgi:glucose-6-phosphate isomerase